MKKASGLGPRASDLSGKRPRGEFARRTIAGWLNKHFYLRLHMTLIIALTFLAGMAATNVLMWLRANPLALRYGLTVTAAYLVFLALIRLWLWYIGIRTERKSSSSGVDLTSDGLDFSNANFGGFMSGGGDASVPSAVNVGGGHFGGGGASGSWGSVASPAAKSSSGGSNAASGLFDIGGDDSGAIALIIAIIVAVVVAAVAAFYVIYTAPAILSEVAFQGVLAAAMARRTRHMSNSGWAGAVFRKTVWAFAAVMAVAIATGAIANHVCPHAVTLRQALHCTART